MAGKRGHGDGSFTKRKDGRWQYQFTLPGGARRSVYGETRAAAKAKGDEIRRNADMGIASLTREQTLAQYLERWLEDVARPAIRPTTYESYESLIRVRVLPDLGRVKLSAVLPQQLQALYNKLQAGGLSAASVRRTHAVLHTAFKQAVRWNLIPRNPAEAARPPSVQRTEMRYLDRVQVTRLIETASDPTLRALYVVAATAGLRRGEMVALRWSDIDLDRRVLTVRRTAHRVKGTGIVFGEPKTRAGRRSVMLGALAVSLLRAHRAAQREHRLRIGPAWRDHDLVFTSAVGTPIEEARITRTFQRDLERARLPRIRLHDLRHTAATLLIEEGVHMKAVQSTLGHATIGITMDTYAHVTPAMQESVAEAMDRLFAVPR